MGWLSNFFRSTLAVYWKGSASTPRAILNFSDTFSLTDNPATDSTEVALAYPRTEDFVIFAGLNSTIVTSPHDHAVSARVINAATMFPWATSATFVCDVIRGDTEDEDIHVTLTDQTTLSDIVDIGLGGGQTPTGELKEFSSDITSGIVGGGTIPLVVYTYTEGVTSSIAITYAAVRFTA